jgi:hypothetical protein
MSKKEIIWREIIEKAAKKEQFEFTQKDLAKTFGFSISTVFNALKAPRAQGAVKVTGKNFSVVDLEKLLYIWATQRNVAKDVAYATFAPMGAKEIEGLMPDGVLFGAYSACAHAWGDAPADYGKVYVYADGRELSEIKKRFPPAKADPNLFVLKKDPFWDRYGTADTVPAQTFADLWNLKEWYAKDFFNRLKKDLLG